MTNQISLEKSVTRVFGEHGVCGEEASPPVISGAEVFTFGRKPQGNETKTIACGTVLLSYDSHSHSATLDLQFELIGLLEGIKNPSRPMRKTGQVWQRVANDLITDVPRDYGYPILERRKYGAVFGPIPIIKQSDLDGACEAAGFLNSNYSVRMEIERLR